jgi:hypothetical protein
MVPPESLYQYLSNEYQCYGVSMSRKITNIFLHSHSDFGDKKYFKEFFTPGTQH